MLPVAVQQSARERAALWLAVNKLDVLEAAKDAAIQELQVLKFVFGHTQTPLLASHVFWLVGFCCQELFLCSDPQETTRYCGTKGLMSVYVAARRGWLAWPMNF